MADSGVQLHVIPSGQLPEVPLEPNDASNAGKLLRGAANELNIVESKKEMTGKAAEEQSRRIAREACKIKRPLPSLARMYKAGNIVHLAGAPHIRHV